MSEQTTAVIEAVTSKEGATNGKAWRKFSVKTEDGTYYSTFDKQIAQEAHDLVGERVEIMWKASGKDGQFRDIIKARAMNGGSADVRPDHGVPADTIPSAQTPSGADWDTIGLRKTRCLLWAEFLGSPLAAAVYDSQDLDGLYRRGVELVTKAERDIYWRPPAEENEDIPFG